MKILLSPSKTQNFIEKAPTEKGRDLLFPKQTKELATVMKSYSANDLAKKMHVSSKLADLNYTRFQAWNPSFSNQKRGADDELSFKQALFAFRGDVYRAFEDVSFSKSEIDLMEKNIRIISGFYGLLTPLTYMKPYRLEMGTKGTFQIRGKEYASLYQYWGDTLTSSLLHEMKKGEEVINLASQEYAKAIDMCVFGDRFVQVDFKVMKNGVPKTIGIYAKQQRGRMAHWIIKNRIEESLGLKIYRNAGFSYASALSKQNHLVFVKR